MLPSATIPSQRGGTYWGALQAWWDLNITYRNEVSNIELWLSYLIGDRVRLTCFSSSIEALGFVKHLIPWTAVATTAVVMFPALGPLCRERLEAVGYMI